jgi:hypothetical protein
MHVHEWLLPREVFENHEAGHSIVAGCDRYMLTANSPPGRSTAGQALAGAAEPSTQKSN